MSRRAWLHIFAVAAVCLLALLVVSLHRARGQAPRGDDPVTRGQVLTREWCSDCHAAGPLGISARPDLNFEAIARMPSTTELSLRVFLQSNHRSMPNFLLRGQDLDDIVAFILSRKAR